ncbi:hypothetical protein OVS_02850 [Mycoplasma ovis str. Michigan]|uniref:Uncharacterized protein n=1 Tax=Mycoplasma ovis str. Michigan TaxID=1415773 RepID=A0ABN4BN06_9MOLU|nr:hypothetical protein [Mycoplasma ovis]AHC40366.1 hypothetical protein OVS_02850 [Mycoplasma ovis str. Michigan]
MALLRGGILSHKLVNLSCVGLISGASISGLIYDLRHEKRVINLINKFGESISNLFDFLNNKSKRESFADLFKGEQLEKTVRATKLLFGDTSQELSKYFKISSNLFTYVLLRFLKEPSKITNKFKRFSGMLSRILKKAQEELPSLNLEGKNPYSLDIAKMSLYLGVKEGGCGEDIFENTWENHMLYRSKTNGSDLEWLKQTQRNSNNANSWSQGIDCSSLFGNSKVK